MERVHQKLWDFPGGLKLDAHKGESTAHPIRSGPLPERLYLPVSRHKGNPAIPVVRTGDHVLRGEKVAIADGIVSAPVHASTSGVVAAIEPHRTPHPSGLPEICIVIDADGEDRCAEPRPVQGDYHHEDPKQLRTLVADAGIVGLGGAAFPTGVKLTAVADALLNTLILNGAECEPYITCDDMLMRERADSIVAGARVMLHILQINRCLIAIENDMPEAEAAMRQAVTSADDDRFQVVAVPARYPEGGERQLIQVLSGLEVPSGGLPLDIGYLCHNVATAFAVGRAVLAGEPLTSRIVTMAGPGIHNPGNYETRLGTPVSDLVARCGGYTSDHIRLIQGGPMNGFALHDDGVPVFKASNCILSLPQRMARPMDDIMPCIRCGECARACPASLLPQQLYWHARADDLEAAQAHALFDCIECGCCDYVCPSHIPLTQLFRYAKAEVWHRDLQARQSDRARLRFEERNRRLERDRAERQAARSARKRRVADTGADEAGKKAEIAAVMERVRNKAPVDPGGSE